MANKKRQPRKKKTERRNKAVGQQRREQQAARTRAAEMNHQAEGRWAAGFFDEAIRLFERAVARDASNAVYQVNLARSYGLRYEYEKAAQLTERILDRFGKEGHVHAMLADSSIRFKDFAAAETHYRRAIELGLQQVEFVRANVALARVLERLHRLDEAVEVAAAAVKRWPDHPKANLIHARVLLRQGQTGSAYEIYEQLSRRTDVSPDVAADSWYALAERHDRDEQYDDSFAALCNAKRAYANFSSKSLAEAETIRDRNQRMLQTLTQEHFDRWQAMAEELQPIPNQAICWLVGHPRSGTTLIEQVLDSHPQLVTADEIEVLASSVYPKLARDTGVEQTATITSMLDLAKATHLNDARKRYLTQIQGAIGHPIGDRVLLDKNPEMTLLLPVIGRVFPEAKILFALRDPRDVVMSCFKQALPLNSVAVHYHTLEGTAAKYAMMMSGWLKLREMLGNRWLEIKYEETVADLERQSRATLNFLELDWDPAVLDYYQRARSKHVHSPTYEAVTKPIYSSAIGRWQNYEKYFEPVLKVLQPFVKEFGY